MSKRNPKDKSTYTFARLGLGKLGHGKITFDCDSMTTCPNCKKEYNFGREKVIALEPRYRNKDGKPDFFWMEWELNTPSIDSDGKGDPLPRVSYILKAVKMTVEDKVWKSNSITDTMTLRTHGKHGLQLKIMEMGDNQNAENR